MSVDRDELLKEIERCEYEKPRLVVWTQMNEFRLQCMKDLAAANATIEEAKKIIAPHTSSDETYSLGHLSYAIVAGLLNATERIGEANATIERLEWREITLENMPGLDDEIGRWHKNNFWQVCSDFASHSIEDYQTEYEGGGWTHFRPVNSPARKAAQ